jgi:hypothetical protein
MAWATHRRGTRSTGPFGHRHTVLTVTTLNKPDGY